MTRTLGGELTFETKEVGYGQHQRDLVKSAVKLDTCLLC